MSKYSDWMMLHTVFNKRNQKGPPSRDDLAAWVRVEKFIKKREETKKKEEPQVIRFRIEISIWVHSSRPKHR